MRTRSRAVAVLMLALVSIAAGPVLGQSPQPWSEQPRRVDFESDSQGFRFTSTRPGAEDQERLGGAFRLADASYEWTFQANRSAALVTSRISFAALLEWRDNDSDGRFGVGDQIVRRQAVESLGNATLEETPRPPQGRIVHAAYPFPGGRSGPLDPLTGRRILQEGGFTLSFHVFGGGATLGSLPTDPSRTPVEIRVENWPRLGNDTKLGLELLLQSGGAMRVGVDAWHASQGLVAQDVTWSDAYTRNGTPRVASVAALARPGPEGLDAAAAQITLVASYDAGNIVHSLSIGTRPHTQAVPDAEVLQALLGDARSYLAGAAACALVVALTATRRLRRRG